MRRIQYCVFSLTAVCMSTARAQRPPAGPAIFTLPAGEHRLESFVDLLGQITRQPITCDAAAMNAEQRSVQLGRDLRLSGDAFEDVACTLLFRRGFLVVVDEKARRVVPLSRPDLYAETASELPVEAVTARPARVTYVTTVEKCRAEDAVRLTMLLRPFLSFGDPRYALKLEATEAGVRLTGATDQVAFAVRLLRMAAGGPLVASDPLPWPERPELEWPGGKLSVAAFAARFSAALDADLLLDSLDAAPDRELDLGEATKLAPAAWFARATVILRGLDCVVVPLLPAQRVFELCSLRGPRSAEVSWRVRFEPSERVGDAADIVPVATIYAPQHIDLRKAMRALRTKVTERSALTVSTFDGTRLLLSGPRDELAVAVATLRATDVK